MPPITPQPLVFLQDCKALGEKKVNIYELGTTLGIFRTREANISPPEGQEQRAPEQNADVCIHSGTGRQPHSHWVILIASTQDRPKSSTTGGLSNA